MKKILYSTISLICVFGAILTLTLIYKQKQNQNRKTEPASSLPITDSGHQFAEDVLSSDSPMSQSLSGPSSSSGFQPLRAPSSNSHNAVRDGGKPVGKSGASQKSSVPEVRNQTPQINNRTAKRPKVAYLTFDDGPSRQTSDILNILKSKNIKATFFVIGKDTDKSNELLRRMVREGHAIGVHSWSHQYSIIYGSETGFLNDFNRLRSHIYQVTGVKPNICRFPGGLNNTVCLKYGGHIMPMLCRDVNAMGIKPFDWNVSAHDACKTPPSKELIIQNILNGCAKHSNAVILLHDTNLTGTTLQALPEVIDNLSARGYRFEALSPSSPSMMFNPV